MPPKAGRVLGCPACGTRVTGKEKACPSCGLKFNKDSKFECPFCGELIREGSLKCPMCNVDLSAISDNIKTQLLDRTLDELKGDLFEFESSHVRVEDRRFACPNCASLLHGTEANCPKCGQILMGKVGFSCPICGTVVEKGARECPRCGISLEKVDRKAEPAVSFGPRSAVSSGGNVGLGKLANSRPCPLCGAIIPKSLQTCPLCGTSIGETTPKESIATPSGESSAADRSQKSAVATVKAVPQTAGLPRERKLRSEKVTTVSVAPQAGAVGRTNGVGQVNGLGKVNGTGAVNGRAFVNGTGISNGLGGRKTESPAKRVSLLARWQFLAVLVAIIIVIPTFIFLSYSNEAPKFSIDGDFSDWERVATFGTRIQSASSISNITEWAVSTQSSDLFLYFRTQAHMMSSPGAESFYLFVDSDGSVTTGYFMESIGADYMLELTGWDSAVNSTSLFEYSSSTDPYDWNAWRPIGSLSYFMDLVRIEVLATMPLALGESAKFVLVSKDSEDRGSVSYTAPLKGGVLIVDQTSSADVAATGIIPRAASAALLTLKFTCEGRSGQVVQVTPALAGVSLAQQEPAFPIYEGQVKTVTVLVNTSNALDGQLVSAKVLVSSIVSDFASVEIIGSGASAYVGTPPATIVIDGAFADWTGRLSVDQDLIRVANPNLDIDKVGNLSNSRTSFFYVSVEGEMCSGSFVPAKVARPSGSGGGGGAVILPRHTAEDTLNVYIDSDKSNITGEAITLASKRIGSDQKITVKGLFGKIMSTKEFNYSSSTGTWVEISEPVEVAKDEKRMEIGVSALSLGGSVDIDFIVETTSWEGKCDLAAFDPSAMKALTRTWIVEPVANSSYATSMSYQRKMFYDGVNYWSFFSDGSNTVHKYSADEGQTWTDKGAVFTTQGVNETSVWYDSSASTVYVVGDTSSATNNVSIQVGVVDSAAHSISWAGNDASLNTSSIPLAGKNTYVCKDLNGYLWVLSSNFTQPAPAAYQLSAFRSSFANDTGSWLFSGQMLAGTSAADNIKGSIVPAGSGSDVWAVFAYSGNVAARKFNGIWQSPQPIYNQAGSKLNTDNSPPSVVVDGKGVVHVVYGNGRKPAGQLSTPAIEYSHNNTDLTTFSTGISLDPLILSGIGDYYPTITLENSTGDLYVLWLQGSGNLAATTVTGKKCVSGIWTDLTIEAQTGFAKLFLTSIYSVSGEFKICWQWTQNVSASFEVFFDITHIPEVGDIVLPILGTLVAVVVMRSGRRVRYDSCR